LRHIWDTVEQREVIASLVGDALKETEPDPSDHPRSRSEAAPDPEELARDLESLESRLADQTLAAAERAILRDRLGLLAGRVQWIADAEKRKFLAARVESIWPKVGGGAA
jgi:MoxR-like ATPase